MEVLSSPLWFFPVTFERGHRDAFPTISNGHVWRTPQVHQLQTCAQDEIARRILALPDRNGLPYVRSADQLVKAKMKSLAKLSSMRVSWHTSAGKQNDSSSL